MQTALLCCPVFEIFIGGARGGGKTDACLGEWLQHAGLYKEHAVGLWVRRSLTHLRETIERAMVLFTPLGAKFNSQTKVFRFPNGARLSFAYLENDSDADSYQGHGYSRVYVEEMGQFPSPDPIFKLMATLGRSKHVPAKLIGSGNPAGAGHHWLRERYIKPAPQGYKILYHEFENPFTKQKIKRDRVFIPSLVTDNKFLGVEYIANLQMSGPPELVSAWLHGNWEINYGSYFPEYQSRHVISPFNIPQHWQRIVGFDWGYHSPFCAVWGAVSSGKDDQGKEVIFPKNAIVIYREVWGKGLDNHLIAKKIADLTGDEDPVIVADPSIFSHDGGPSINDQFKDAFAKLNFKPRFKPADNDRVSGWSQIRRRFTPNPAYLFIFSSCPYLLETIPASVMDPKNPEDLDTTGNDHGLDALRYLCKERLLESKFEEDIKPAEKGRIMIDQYIKHVRREQDRPRV